MPVNRLKQKCFQFTPKESVDRSSFRSVGKMFHAPNAATQKALSITNSTHRRLRDDVDEQWGSMQTCWTSVFTEMTADSRWTVTRSGLRVTRSTVLTLTDAIAPYSVPALHAAHVVSINEIYARRRSSDKRRRKRTRIFCTTCTASLP